VTKAIRTYFTDFVAIIVVAALALATLLYILSNQKAALPSWIPGLGQEFYELNAEFSTSQSVTAGQGQGIMISGIQVGKVGEVNLINGRAVVRMDIEPEYAELIHEDATLLLRPKTGLNDMVIEVDPGTRGETPPEGATIPMAQTAPNINPDEVLATLDADTRDYLTLLLQGGAAGLGGQGRQLSAGLRRFEPTARDLARLGRALAKRRRNIRGVIHNFRLVAEELGSSDAQLARFVDASNAALGAFASQQDALAQSVAELPPTLRSTRANLARANELSVTMAPALLALIPQAVELQPALESAQNLFTDTLSPLRDQIRPFTRQIQPTIRHLNQASDPLRRTAAGSRAAFGDLNNFLAKLAFNPRGESNEGYLFWLTWLNHATNAIYLTQDAEGPLHRGLLTVSCSTVKFGEITAVANELLKTELEATDLPQPAEICENYTPLPTFP
jgi:phospholipid/cholesterol/gamma-HCH transport system substrate-binding protein